MTRSNKWLALAGGSGRSGIVAKLYGRAPESAAWRAAQGHAAKLPEFAAMRLQLVVNRTFSEGASQAHCEAA